MEWAELGDGREFIWDLHRKKNVNPILVMRNVVLLTKFMMRDLMRGLAHLHARGIVHHDLKLENTLVFKNRIVVIFFNN